MDQRLDLVQSPLNMSVYPKDQIGPLLVEIELPACYRIFPSRYEDTPLETVPANSRFCTADSDFSILYAAQSFATAFIEVVVRDRFTQKDQRIIRLEELSERSYACIVSIPGTKLLFLDLRQDGCLRIGAPTDAVNARNHADGQELARDIHDNHVEVDGLLFSSRLAGEDIYAIFDIAIPRVTTVEIDGIIEHPQISDLFQRYGIQLIKCT